MVVRTLRQCCAALGIFAALTLDPNTGTLDAED